MSWQASGAGMHPAFDSVVALQGWDGCVLMQCTNRRKVVWSGMTSVSRAVKKTPRSQAELPPIRVRREPPTIAEAVVAAQDLADDLEQQVEIAAGLIGLPPDEVRPHVLAAER